MNTRVSYQQLFPLTAYLNERIGLEMDVPDGIDPLQVLSQLKEMAETFHKTSITSLEPKPITIEQVDEKEGKDPIAGHITAINSASNLAALNWHRALVEKEGDNHPELREAFDKKLQGLNNK